MNCEGLLALSTGGDVSLECKEYLTRNFYFLLTVVSAFSQYFL